MNPRLTLALVLAVAFSSTANAGTQLKLDANKDQEAYQRLYDHPPSVPVPNRDVKLEVTYDKILRSCCAPPSLVVVGNVINMSHQPIDYMKIMMTLRDATGRVVHSEDVYNHKAVSMGEDAMVAEILKEKPHFDPMPPGDKDTFTFEVPLPGVPRYQSCRVAVSEIKRRSGK